MPQTQASLRARAHKHSHLQLWGRALAAGVLVQWPRTKIYSHLRIPLPLLPPLPTGNGSDRGKSSRSISTASQRFNVKVPTRIRVIFVPKPSGLMPDTSFYPPLFPSPCRVSSPTLHPTQTQTQLEALLGFAIEDLPCPLTSSPIPSELLYKPALKALHLWIPEVRYRRDGSEDLIPPAID